MVLVKNQGTSVENGVYAVKSGAWVEQDWSTDSVIVAVDQGAVNGGNLYTNLVGTTPLERNFSATQITSGTLDAARVPNFDAAKITTGELNPLVLPRRSVFGNTQGTFAANTATGRHSPISCLVNQTTASGSSMATNAIWMPFFIPRATQVVLSLNCTTLQASAVARMSIFSFNEATLAPTALVEDMGTVSLASTGLKQITTAGTHSGYVFGAVWLSNHTSVRCTRVNPDPSGSNPFGGPGGTNTRVNFGWIATGLDYSASWPAGSPPALTIANNSDHIQYLSLIHI